MKIKKVLLILLVVIILLIIIVNWFLKSWMEGKIALANSDCKNVVSQQVYQEMDSYKKDKNGNIIDSNAILPLANSQVKLKQCIIDKTVESFSFLGEGIKKQVKARLELRYKL